MTAIGMDARREDEIDFRRERRYCRQRGTLPASFMTIR